MAHDSLHTMSRSDNSGTLHSLGGIANISPGLHDGLDPVLSPAWMQDSFSDLAAAVRTEPF